MSTNYTTASALVSVPVTIPVNGSAARISTLVESAFPVALAVHNTVAIKVRETLADGTTHDAFLFGGSADACNSYIAEGVAEELPGDQIGNIFVEAPGVSTVSAIFDCWVHA